MKFALMWLVILAHVKVVAQEKWSLRECIDYARSENIQIKKADLVVEGYEEDVKQTKAALFPSLNANISQQFSNSKVDKGNGNYRYEGVFNGQYGINASWTIYNGKQNINAIKEAKINKQASELDKEETGNNIEISITQAYLQVIYAWESIKNNQNIVETSKIQLKQTQDFLDAGSITRSEYAQVEAQYSSDKYNLVLAQNAFDNYKLQLKQLLELGIDEPFDVVIPDSEKLSVIDIIPNKKDVYEQALTIMPQIQSSELKIDLAHINQSKAKAGYLPTISLVGSLGTGNIYNESPSFFTQLGRRFNQSIGLSVSIPIFDNRKTKSAIQKAKLQVESVKLDYTDAQKTLLRTIEELYQEATSSQSKYYAAIDKLKSAKLSYELVSEQYDLGMRNTVELTSEKNNYANALQESLQAKYSAILSLKLLKFYQGEKITL